jgi:hypothetical protein
VVLYLLSYNRMKLRATARDRTADLLLTMQTLVPTELRRRVVELTGLESNQRTRDPKSRRPCQQSTGHREPVPRIERG